MFLSSPIIYVPRPSGFRIRSIGAFIGAVGEVIFYLGILAFFVLLIWGGVEWLTSGGDKGKLQTARDRITFALAGLTIISLARAILILLEAFFGICIIGSTCNALPTGY